MGIRKQVLNRNITSADPEDGKRSVRFVTTAPLAAYTRVGNTITANAVGAMAAQDGVVPAQGDEFLLVTGAAAADNGIWVVTDPGDGFTAFVLDRREDANRTEFVNSGMRTTIEEGSAYGARGASFVLVTPNPIVLNTTGLSFVEAVPGGSGGGAFTTTAVQTAPGPYNASAFEIVLVDPSGGAFTVNLPALPTKDDQIGYINVTTDTTTITVSGNGNNINGSATQSLVDPEQAEMFIYTGSEWRMM